jgi:hypothetical protein
MSADRTLALEQMESETATLNAQLETANAEISTLAAEKDDIVVMAAEEVRLAHCNCSWYKLYQCVNVDGCRGVSQVEGLEARIEELTAAASTESTAKSAEFEQQLQQLREEKEEVDSYLSELEAAAIQEGETNSIDSRTTSYGWSDTVRMVSNQPCAEPTVNKPKLLMICDRLVLNVADETEAAKAEMQAKIEKLTAEVAKVKKMKRASAKAAAESMEKANALMARLADEGALECPVQIA